jgi:hypothetical protein
MAISLLFWLDMTIVKLFSSVFVVLVTVFTILSSQGRVVISVSLFNFFKTSMVFELSLLVLILLVGGLSHSSSDDNEITSISDMSSCNNSPHLNSLSFNTGTLARRIKFTLAKHSPLLINNYCSLHIRVPTIHTCLQTARCTK